MLREHVFRALADHWTAHAENCYRFRHDRRLMPEVQLVRVVVTAHLRGDPRFSAIILKGLDDDALLKLIEDEMAESRTAGDPSVMARLSEATGMAL